VVVVVGREVGEEVSGEGGTTSQHGEGGTTSRPGVGDTTSRPGVGGITNLKFQSLGYLFPQ
jgi:hypothetical protein